MTRNSRTIGVVGDYCVAAITRFQKKLSLNKHVYVQNINFIVGGAAGLIACQIAALSGKVYSYGAVGNDFHGDFIRHELLRRGVSTNGLRTVKGQTGRNIVLLGDNRRTVVANFGVHTAYPRMLKNVLFQKHAAYFVPSYPTYLNLLKQLARKGSRLVTDISFSDNLRLLESLISKVLPFVNIAVLSKEYISRRVFERLRRYLVPSRQIAVTDGKRGAYLLTHKEIIFSPPYPTEAVDVNGAGDTFTAGLLYAFTQGSSFLEIMDFAQALAATKISRVGFIPTLSEIKEMYSLRNRKRHLKETKILPLRFSSFR